MAMTANFRDEKMSKAVAEVMEIVGDLPREELKRVIDALEIHLAHRWSRNAGAQIRFRDTWESIKHRVSEIDVLSMVTNRKLAA